MPMNEEELNSYLGIDKPQRVSSVNKAEILKDKVSMLSMLSIPLL